MLRNQLKLALRHLARHRAYSAINIVGLAAAVACCLLIGYYVVDELRYDSFHEGGERTYRVVSDVRQPEGEVSALATVVWPVGRILEDERPEVDEQVYLRRFPAPHVRHDGRVFSERVLFAEPEFFDVFSFDLLSGDPARALEDPSSVVLAKRTAEKIFGGDDPLGKQLRLTVASDTLDVTVSGVVEDPTYSHIDFDLLLPFDAFIDYLPGFHDGGGWGNYNVFSYIRLREGTDPSAFERSISDLFAQKDANRHGYETTLRLQALPDIYLRADTGSWLGPSGNIAHVYLLATIGLFILLLAGINFVNLSTARAGDRAREVGIRKTVGSGRPELVAQFLTESVLTCLLAAAAGAALAIALLPLFNHLAGKQFVQQDLLNPLVLGSTAIFALVVGLLAGAYPSVVLARFRPIEVLKGRFSGSRKGVRLRSGLVVVQFAISCVLIMGTLIVLRQLNYMQSQDVGFQREGVVVIDAGHTPSSERSEKWELLVDQVLAHSAAGDVSVTHGLPGRTGWSGQWIFPEGARQDAGLSVEYLAVDENYVEAFGLSLVAGRDFSDDMRSDSENALLINETAARALGWETAENAVGKFIDSPSGYPRGRVVGVVADYHHHSLKEAVGPIVMDVNPQAARFLAVRTNAGNTAGLLAHLEETWASIFPDFAFEHFFLDADYERQYLDEQRMQSVFTTFSILAILIACLGLFGLATYATSKRVKEIGVRKVFGATVSGIVLLLSRDFLRLVGVAFLIAGPIAYVFGTRWLEDFAYRTELGLGIFLFAGAAAASIALFTTSFQAVRAARRNPADVLRYE